jgi:peptidoglycan/LPS O-acetylase OafA/YrhL
MGTSSKRLYYLDSLKYIFCLMIFWAHLAGVFWTLCDPRPALRPELERLFTYPLSVLLDSSLALYGFCILSGYLASFKRTRAQNLLPQLLARYLRFVVPFFFINLVAFILYYTVGYPTAEASALLHNAWLATYYTHAPTIPELLRATVTLDGDLNGPLWMMKYILLGTCIIYLYNAVEQKLPFRLFQFTCLAVFVYSFFHLPEPNFFHVHLVLMGLILRKLNDALKAWLTQHEKDGHPLLRFFFLLLVLLPIALDAGGLQRVLYPFFRAHCPSIAPVFIWNAYWVMLFSFSLIVGVMNCPPLQRALEWAPLKRVAPMNFAVYLVHFPLIASLSLHLYLRLVNRISYSKVFVILTVVSFAALFLTSWLYEQSIGKLQDKIVKKLTACLAK